MRQDTGTSGVAAKKRKRSALATSAQEGDLTTTTRPIRAARTAARNSIYRSAVGRDIDSTKGTDHSPSARSILTSKEDDDIDMHGANDFVSEANLASAERPSKASDSQDNQGDFLEPPTKRLRLRLNPPRAASSFSKKKKMPEKSVYKLGIDTTKPPLFEISAIFADLTRKALSLGFENVTKHLGTQTLNVATMCSGTESPLLALQMVASDLKKHHDIDLLIDHKFSAEIVPWKQAYIDRNFDIRLIYRDVIEMAENDTPSTAYGAPAAIPRCVDMVIAGFSCVDFSGLNNNRKQYGDDGESTHTINAIMTYARKHRPALIILENVSSAPWIPLKAKWQGPDLRYEAAHRIVDTKDYYMPQTRRRGYMICIDTEKAGFTKGTAEKWVKLMAKFRRPASSPVDAFLLDDDDPRLHQAKDEVTKNRRGERKIMREIDWTAGKGRHLAVRREMGLGSNRPCTEWVENGANTFFEFGWKDWSKVQVDRVKDSLEIHFLRNARRGYDSSYKPRVWELSQNCDDRFTDTTSFGLTCCITPSGQPYHTARARPIIGLEALALQGLPIDQLLLTRESQKQLQELAGNAMTSTVVGAAILSALIVGYKTIAKSSLQTMAPNTTLRHHVLEYNNSHRKARLINFESRKQMSVPDLCAMAVASSRRCLCEGQVSTTARHLLKCMDCSHTACERCRGIPKHNYPKQNSPRVLNRIQPSKFADIVKQSLPATLRLNKLKISTFQSCMKKSQQRMLEKVWNTFIEAVAPALGEELRFVSTKRSQFWTIAYDAQHSRMELVFTRERPQWFLYAKPNPAEPEGSPIRRLLRTPVARMSVNGDDLLHGIWEVCLPITYRFQLTVKGKEKLVPSWESNLGLTEPFDAKMVWSFLEVESNSDVAEKLEIDLTGTYKLLPNCGTASGSLHVRMSSNGSEQLYLFFDPDRVGNPKLDTFVFSTDIRRLNYGETRHTVARVDHRWKPSSAQGRNTMNCSAFGVWAKCKAVLELLEIDHLATFATPRSAVSVPIISGAQIMSATYDPLETSCADGIIAILSCAFPVTNARNEIWKEGPWQVIDKSNERRTFISLSWLPEKVRRLDGISKEWRPLKLPRTHIKCQVCAPDRPQISWQAVRPVKKGPKEGVEVDADEGAEEGSKEGAKAVTVPKLKFVPYEDPRQAGPFERAIKARPTPFLTRMRVNNERVRQLEIGLNVPTLAHRALAKHSDLLSYDGVELSWRLDTQYLWPATISLPRFKLLNNKLNLPMKHVFEQSNKHGEKCTLRLEQQRSFGWMVKQEAENAPPFHEEEIEEAFFPHLNWRVESRVTRPRYISGGMLADEVGFGKTITILALVDKQKNTAAAAAMIERPGYISLKATLIIVPRTLIPQWTREAKQFLGEDCVVLIVNTAASLAKYTVANYREADIVLLASNIIGTPTYLRNYSFFAALPEPRATGGRFFDAWLGRASDRVSEHLRELQSQPFNSGFADNLQQRLQIVENDENKPQYVPSRRLKAKDYAASRIQDEVETLPGGSKVKLASKLTLRKVNASGSGAGAALKDNIFHFKKAKDLNGVSSPLFHMFHFHRLVIDEFTYFGHKNEYAFLTSIKASKRWILSGTPSLRDFVDVKTIAGFLGIKLGVDDDARGILRGQNIAAIGKDRTAAEHFQSFKQSQSPDWHLQRQANGQRFLYQFARQNKAENNRIKVEVDLEAVDLPTTERGLYLELQQQAYALESRVQNGRKGSHDNDRADRINQILASSKSPQEALLKSCSFLSTDFMSEDPTNAVDGCQTIINVRKDQRDALLDRLQDQISQGTFLKSLCGNADKHYSNWKTDVHARNFGDEDACKQIENLIAAAEASTPTAEEDASKENLTLLRKWSTTLRLWTDELVTKERALRFFRNLDKVQLWLSHPDPHPSCDDCGMVVEDPTQFLIFGLCGHTACSNCLNTTYRDNKCPVNGCNAAVFDYHIIRALEVGREGTAAPSGHYYGKKIEQVINLIKNDVPNGEQVLLFIQFDDLMERIAEAFTRHHISHFALTEAANRGGQKAAKMMDAFQTDASDGKRKVLMLNSANESAAGANLTNANHVIFISPVLSTTQHGFNASETQCIGRARRHGQSRTVQVYKFLSLRTLDVDITQERKGKKVVRGSGNRLQLKSQSELTEEECGEDLGSCFVNHFLVTAEDSAGEPE